MRIAVGHPVRALATATVGVMVAALLLLTQVMAAHAAPVSDTQNGIIFEVDDGDVAAGATVTGYDRSQGTDVTIPDTVTIAGTEYSVTAIADAAFERLDPTEPALTSVTIPDTVVTIGEGAFAYNDLTTVDIPNSVTSLGEYAFGANQLTSVTIPNSLTVLESSLFEDNQLTSVTIPSTITSIGERAFVDNAITSLVIPDSVQTIWPSAFQGNEIASLVLGSSVTSIYANAFELRGDQNITIPASVEELLGSRSFIINEISDEVHFYFEGDAPLVYNFAGPNGPLHFAETSIVHFQSGASGFTTPTWNGYEAHEGGTPPPRPMSPLLTRHCRPLSTKSSTRVATPPTRSLLQKPPPSQTSAPRPAGSPSSAASSIS